MLIGGGGTYRYKWKTSTSAKAGPGNMFRTWTRYDTKTLDDGDLEFKTLVKDEVLKQIGPASGNFRGAPGAPLSVDNVQSLLAQQMTVLDASYRLDAAYMGRANSYIEWKAFNPSVLALVAERTKFNLEQWAAIGLTHTLPGVQATEVSDEGYTLSVAAANATIYFTADGSDPIGNSGAVPGAAGANPAAQVYTPGLVIPSGAAVRAYTPGNWGPMTTVK
jgi:hypothetical protein